jgi:MFS family permease
MALFALAFGNGSIYIMPYIKYVFYYQQMEVMGINNTQSGLLLAVYAISSMILFIPGGMIADRFLPKKCILLSLLVTVVIIIIYAFTLNFAVALIIWVGFAFSSAFVFWPAMIIAISKVGKDEEHGRMYGIFYFFNGIIAAAIGTVALYVATKFDTLQANFFWAIVVIATSVALSALFILIFYSDKSAEVSGEIPKENKFKWSATVVAFKNPYTWIMAMVCFAAYSIYSSNTYFTPYLIDVHFITPTASAVFSIIRTYLFMFFAFIGGLIADKVLKSTAKFYIFAFSIMAILLVAVFILPENINPFWAGIYTLFPAAVATATYGTLFSIMRELAIPEGSIGAVIGVSSCLSWSPDLFMHTMYGYWLDKMGNTGYGNIFVYQIVLCVIQIVVCCVIWKKAKRQFLGNRNPQVTTL